MSSKEEFWAGRRSQAPVAVLSRAHDQVATTAVDPAEIAATLEAAGVNDCVVRERYGHDDVFGLAREIYDMVPCHLRAAHDAPDPWARPLRRHLTRGLVYALPMLMYAGALRLVGNGSLWLLLVASVVCAGLGLGTSFVAHLLLGWQSPRGARRILRGSVPVGVLAGLAAWAIIDAPASTLLLAGCLAAYSLSASVLVVMGREGRLLVLLAPGAGVAALALTGAPVARWFLVLAMLATVLLVVGAAWASTAQLGRDERLDAMVVTWPVVRTALLHTAWGSSTALLTASSVTGVLDAHGHDGVSRAVTALLLVPLVLGYGPAERHLSGARSDGRALLRDLHSSSIFTRELRVSLLRRGLEHLGWAAALRRAAGRPADRRDEPHRREPRHGPAPGLPRPRRCGRGLREPVGGLPALRHARLAAVVVCGAAVPPRLRRARRCPAAGARPRRLVVLHRGTVAQPVGPAAVAAALSGRLP